jgi:hypothetical protein
MNANKRKSGKTSKEGREAGKNTQRKEAKKAKALSRKNITQRRKEITKRIKKGDRGIRRG